MVGGHDAAEGQFPYVVSIQTSQGDHFCGGSIISSRWILTASHCVSNRIFGTYHIRVGSNQFRDGLVHEIQQVFPHARFNINTNQHDIATVRTTLNIEFNIHVSPIPVATIPLPLDTVVTIIGWGQPSVSIF